MYLQKLVYRLSIVVEPEITNLIIIACTSSHFIEFKFHRAWKIWVGTPIAFSENEFFEFKLEFRNEFVEFCLQHFECFEHYRVQVSQKYKLSESNFIQFKIWVVKLVEFLSFEYLVKVLIVYTKCVLFYSFLLPYMGPHCNMFSSWSFCLRNHYISKKYQINIFWNIY